MSGDSLVLIALLPLCAGCLGDIEGGGALPGAGSSDDVQRRARDQGDGRHDAKRVGPRDLGR